MDRWEIASMLRFLAGGWVSGEDNQRWLVDTARAIERTDPAEWICCPLCAETICDEDCPCEELRVHFVANKSQRGSDPA